MIVVESSRIQNRVAPLKAAPLQARSGAVKIVCHLSRQRQPKTNCPHSKPCGTSQAPLQAKSGAVKIVWHLSRQRQPKTNCQTPGQAPLTRASSIQNITQSSYERPSLDELTKTHPESGTTRIAQRLNKPTQYLKSLTAENRVAHLPPLPAPLPGLLAPILVAAVPRIFLGFKVATTRIAEYSCG